MSVKVDTKALAKSFADLKGVTSRDNILKALMAGGLVIEGTSKAKIVEYDFIDTGATLNSDQARPADDGSDEVWIGPATEYAIFGPPFMQDGFKEGEDEAMAAVAEEVKHLITEAAR